MFNFRSKISIIIPAYNDGKQLKETLEKLQEIKLKEYPDLEIVVSVTKSKDNTELIARKYADKVEIINEKGPSLARNKGALKASGEIFVFLDADVQPLPGTISLIAQSVKENIIGTCTAYPDEINVKSLLLSWIKNFLRSTGILKGMSELLFCHRKLFHEKGIYFNPQIKLGEIQEFIHHARKKGKAKYKYLRRGGYKFSVRRYERVGYLKTLLFWIRWWLFTQILKHNPLPFEREYWREK